VTLKADLADLSAERALLASMLADPRCCDAYACPPDAWTRPAHEAVAIAMRELLDAGLRVTEATVVSHLRQRGSLETVGGPDAIYALSTGGALMVDVAVTHERVTHLAGLRRKREHLRRALAAVECEDATAAAMHAAAALEDEAVRAADSFSLAEAVEGAYMRAVSTTTRGLIPTGIGAVDAAITGLGPGDLGIVGADTNVGKSSLALTMGERLGASGMLLGYISTEDPRHLIEDRLLSRFSRVSGQRIRSRSLDADDHVRIAGAVAATRAAGSDAGFVTSCMPGATDADVVREMARLVRVRHCDAVFVDYAQAITCSTKAENVRAEVRLVASRIKSAAARLGVPVWLASQLTVERGESREPGKHDLRDSRDLAHLAELVLVLWRKEEADSAVVYGKIAKGKAGGNGVRFAFSRGAGGSLRECEVPDEAEAPRSSRRWGAR
jgi:replicative DNA helicase